MILKLYHKLEIIAVDHFVVTNSKIIYLPSGETQKLRIFLVDGTILDIWISITNRYSYHWDRRINKKGIYRFDNAPTKNGQKYTLFQIISILVMRASLRKALYQKNQKKL